MFSFQVLSAFLATASLTSAHLVLNYPGWRGDNLQSNGTKGWDDYRQDLFPYGMQWAYPCGGWGITDNRTYWPTTGGAVAFEPGWFEGHKTAFVYVNLGIWPDHNTPPGNYNNIMQPVFEIIGPTNDAYPHKPICLPQVPTPANYTAKEGDYGTIQVVMNGKHGAALYSCVDIIFTEDISKVQPINESNCYNDSSIQLTTVFNTASLTSDAVSRVMHSKAIALVSSVTLALGAWLML